MTVFFVAFYDAVYDGNLVGLEPLETTESHSHAVVEFLDYVLDGGETPEHKAAQVVALEDLPTAATALL